MAQLPPHADSLLTPDEPDTKHHHAPSDPDEINPKLASDIAYWSKELGVTGQVLHEAIRVHGSSVAKVRHALEAHQVSLSTKNGE